MADTVTPSNAGKTTKQVEEAGYEVGYGQPPKHSQFKKGNKRGKGRPRGSRNMGSIVRDALETRVAAKINGQTRKISKIELSMHQLANKASSGDLKAIAQVTALYERHCPPEDDATIPKEQTAYDIETLRHYFVMRGEADDE